MHKLKMETQALLFAESGQLSTHVGSTINIKSMKNKLIVSSVGLY